MKKTTIFSIVIFVLLACNIFLLYTNIDRQNEINALVAAQNVEPETTITAGEILAQNTKVIHPEVILPNTGVSLVVFFTIRSCSSCLEYEVPNLNTFYEQFSENTEAYLITGGKPFLKSMAQRSMLKLSALPIRYLMQISLLTIPWQPWLIRAEPSRVFTFRKQEINRRATVSMSE